VDASRASEVAALLALQYELDPQTHREVWVPYIQGLKLDWSFPLETVNALDSLRKWVNRAPFARFRMELTTSSPRLVTERLASPLFRHVCALHVDGHQYPHRAWTYARKIASAPSIAHLSTLSLANIDMGGRNLDMLVSTAHLTDLRELVLEGPSEQKVELRWLTESHATPALEHLHVTGGGVDDDGAQALADATWLGRLTRLTLRDNAIGDDGLVALATSPNLPALTHVDVSGNPITEGGVFDVRRARPDLELVVTH
jgi:hypothetical protein